FRSRRSRVLGHAARHETADRDLIVEPHRPNHRAPRAVRFGDDGVVGNVDPVILEADPVMAVLGFPIRARDAFTIRHRAAHSLAAGEMIEPRLERRIRVTAVQIASYY